MATMILSFCAGFIVMAACLRWSDHPLKIFAVYAVAIVLIVIGQQIK